MTERIETVLAWVTIAMPIALALAHAFKAIAARLYEHALTTPSTADDRIVARIVLVADWLYEAANAIGHVASLGVLKRGVAIRPSADDEITARESPTSKRLP